jgi:polysaccharide biosynthesis protein VpsQ
MDGKIRKILFFLLAFLSLGLVAFIIFSADEGTMPVLIKRLYDYPNGDKLGHFLLMGSLAFVVALALPWRWKLRGLLILAGLLTLEECSQLLFPRRTFDLLDLACSLAGIAAFGWLNWILTRGKKADM